MNPSQLYQSLQRHNTLQSLSLQFPHHPLGKPYYDLGYLQLRNPRIPDAIPVQPNSISGFKNLTSLELYSLPIQNGISGLITEIAAVLLGNPGLRKLGLSLACKWDCASDSIITPPQPPDFLRSLASAYGALEGANPLSIETLRIGDGVTVQRHPMGKQHAVSLY